MSQADAPVQAITDYLLAPHDNLLVSLEGRVGIIRLNRPKALNALDSVTMRALDQVLRAMDGDDRVGAIVLTGDTRAFAAGADIREMSGAAPFDLLKKGMIDWWDGVRAIAKPIIAAVSGHCLGGGLELAMLCDVIIASESARFAQPEVAIGVIPGAGGTQRLTRLLGRQKAMAMILTGDAIDAAEALRSGLVYRVVPTDLYLEEAIAFAARIASLPPLAVRMAKMAVHAADETHLPEGIRVERQAFYMLFATEDQKEGMAAFNERRAPVWKGC